MHPCMFYVHTLVLTFCHSDGNECGPGPCPEADLRGGGGSSMVKPCPASGVRGHAPPEILNIYIEIIRF